MRCTRRQTSLGPSGFERAYDGVDPVFWAHEDDASALVFGCEDLGLAVHAALSAGAVRLVFGNLHGITIVATL